MLDRRHMTFLAAAAAVTALLLTGCGAKPASSITPDVVATPSDTPIITLAPAATPSPVATAIETKTPEAAQTPATANGFTPEIANFLRSYTYDEIAEYNEPFTDSTRTDMDGDGAGEEVKLEVRATKVIGEFEYYTSLKVSIGGKELVLKADPGWNYGYSGLTLSGTILDLNKGDGKKELLISAQNNYEAEEIDPEVSFVLVAYTGSEPKILTELDYLPEATGTGYVAGVKYSRELAGGYTIAIQSYQRYLPESATFEEMKADEVKALSYTSFAPEEEEGYPTGWDQAVAKEPGEDTVDTVKKGTPVYFGLYHEKGWMEIHDAEGNTLGWLDLTKVDVDKYINYAIEASCH